MEVMRKTVLHLKPPDYNTKKMIGKGEKLEDLYVLDVDKLDVAPMSESFLVAVNIISVQTWHKRLGHYLPKD